MSYNKSIDSSAINSDLTSVANAIRAKSGGSGQLAFPAGFVSEINNIPTGGGGVGELVKANCTLSCTATTYTGDTNIPLPRAAAARDVYVFKITSGTYTANANSYSYSRDTTGAVTKSCIVGYSVGRPTNNYCLFEFATNAGDTTITPTAYTRNNLNGTFVGDLYVIHMGEFDTKEFA